MVYDFLITLKKQDNKLPDRVSQLMYIFSILAFGYFLYQYQKSGIVYLIVILAILVSWIFAIRQKRKDGNAFFRLGLFFCAAGWFFGPEKNIWLGLLYAIAAVLEKQVKFPQEVGFTENEITFNTLPKRILQWNEVSNVVIKDGLLTIDQKNNKLYQIEIEGYVTREIEKEFNDFCFRQLKNSQ